MISSPNRSSRGGRAVRLIVIHTAEGARTTGALGSFFARASVQASSHVGIDDNGLDMYVPYDQASWTVLSGNPISENAELCGFAAWTRQTWLNEHMPMLRNAAAWIRERCLARGIPIRKLSPAQVGAGQAGVCGHVDWTLGMRDGTHTDPGPGFPWDVVMSMASSGAPVSPPPIQEDDMTPDQARMLEEVHRELTTRLPNRRGPDGEFREVGFPGDTTLGYAANADGYGFRTEQTLAEISQKVDDLTALVRAAGVDPAAVQAAITSALGGGLTITGTAVPANAPKG